MARRTKAEINAAKLVRLQQQEILLQNKIKILQAGLKQTRQQIQQLT